ncbi:PHP domain-containing protein [Boudabousia marimammalium]|uniref:Polymerase/histidinol phosphatase N-terminal domain-containing protein n=1 Tax=Boudabousia marimammalium TaxID=156892 RepID=A0A1Q5PM36_9ACTO|nr:PHP domain-containing protein [Boudabousia marimammalium]OKL48106.1 hypothetical protein BM477_06520 [Boudabousia marimammalium]
MTNPTLSAGLRVAPDARIDLHTHSSVSDGTDTPTELIRQAAEAGLNWVALTDHDTHSSWEEALAAAEDVPMNLLCGTEVSTNLNGNSVHLLAYGYEPGGVLDQMLAKARRSRITRAQDMVDGLAKDYEITWEQVLAQTQGDGTTVGRPHLADALVQTGEFPDRTAAFNGPLAGDSKYYVPYWAPSTPEAISAVRDSGGVPVIAHPFSVTRDFTLTDEEIALAVEAGLMGLERDHRDHGLAERQKVAGLAERFGLFVTGSSDFHGDGKPNRLGENLTQPEVLQTILEHCATGVYWAEQRDWV